MPPPTTPEFEALYREQFVFVWRALYRLGVREADVPDACQEVFLVAHRRLPEFEGRAKVTTWLFRICLRVASGHLRRAHVKREVQDDVALAGELSTERDPESSRAHREGLRLLELALDALTLEQRTVFVLFELEGFSSAEIAETLEIPLGTVYSRLRSARERFEQRLKRRSAAGVPLFAGETT
jgi:RNA polymerase sigma-70 factor (ECF subfamily)